MNYKRIGSAINFVAKFSLKKAQGISFKLFTTPRPRKQKQPEIDFLQTATTSSIQHNNQKLQIYHWGNTGPKILFSHGWESNAGRWRSFIPPLVDKGFQVIAFDAPAHGASEGKQLHLIIFMQAIQAIYKEYGEFYALVGHSMGGGASTIAMAHHQLPHPKKMVLLGAFNTVKEVYHNYADMLGLSPKLEHHFNKTIKHLSGKEITYFSVANHLAQLSDIQGLIIHDTQDQTINVQEAQDNANAWQESQYIETEKAGHSLQNEEIFDHVISFLSEKI